MIKLTELPIFAYLIFTILYASVGDPNCNIWSGLYFTSNYLLLLYFFSKEKNESIRFFGISLSISILIFIFLKYIFEIDIERVYTFLIFLVTLALIFKISIKR